MRVDVDDMIAGCPDECPHAVIEVSQDVVHGIGGATAVFVSVRCEHYPVCRIRDEAEDGDD